MVDRHYTDRSLAARYDLTSNPREDFGFYLPSVMQARSVLDVGCGTGELLRLAREAGHSGRLVGLDPAQAMLDVARRRRDVEWVHGDLTAAAWHEEFDLIVMTGHAFQVLLDDDEVRRALAAIRSALSGEGRFIFETRNPRARVWERWHPGNAVEIAEADGSVLRMVHQVEQPVVADRVSFTTTYTNSAWDSPRTSRSTLRFLDVEALARFLDGAGLVVEQQFGDWRHRPLDDGSPEIITITRRR